MKRRHSVIRGVLSAFLLLLSGCFSTSTFVKSVNPNWAGITVRADQTYDQAWDATADYLVKRFDMDLLSRTDGYLRTHWLYTWKGEYDKKYRVRVALKFSADRKTLEIKTEAQKGGENKWVLGYDTQLRESIRAELTDLIGIPAGTGAAK